MQLPFTVRIVPPTRTDFKRLVRSRAAWLVAMALLLGTSASVFFVLGSARRSGPPVPSGRIRLVGVPSDVTVAVDGQPLAQASPVPSLPAGEHVVAFHGERVVDASYDVVVHPDATTTLAPDLWLRHPRIAPLRPTYPGSSIVGASFLADGRIALVEALPPGNDDQLWLVDPNGAPRRVGPADQSHAIALAPDGRRVAYLVQGNTATTRRMGLDEVWIAGSGGGDERRSFALPPDDPGESLVDLSWAPDGQHLLIASRVADRSGGRWSRLRWLDLANGEARELATFPGDVVFGSYTWSPVGDRVAFMTRVGQTSALCALDIASTTFQDVAELGGGAAASFPFAPVAWSDDGQRLIYSARSATSASSGWLFGAQPSIGLDAVDFPRPISRRLGSDLGQFPAVRADGAVVLVDHPRSDAPYVVRQLEPKGQSRDLFSVAATPSSAFAVLWDLAHDQAILATRAANSTGSAPIDYWLVRFGVEASR